MRMALGATARDILLSFSRRGLALTVAGLAIGLLMTVRAITTLFYGFQPDFVGAVALAAAVLLTVAALACLVPARIGASRINPAVVLQHE